MVTINTISNRIIKPVRESLYFLFGMCAIRFIANSLRLDFFKSDYLLYVCEIYLFSFLISFCKIKVRRWIEITLLFLAFLLNFIESFLFRQFGMLISPFALQLVAETNQTEANGFLNEYLFNEKTLVVFAFYFPALIITTILYSNKDKLSSHKIWDNRYLQFIISLSIICSFAISPVCIKSSHSPFHYLLRDDVELLDKGLCPYSAEMRLLQSMAVVNSSLGDNDKLINLLMNIDVSVIDTCSFTSPHIILYIGESCIKRHCQFLGYKQETNPFLNIELNNGNLFVYKDVVTPKNATDIALKHIFSVPDVDSDSQWYELPTFPFLFKLAGYNVSLISNQIQETSNNFFDFKGSYFLVNTTINNLCFDYRNHDNPPLEDDMDLLEQVDSIQPGSHSLLIFQGKGMHTPYADRCPDNEKVFSADNYSDRSELTNEQKQIVADYDNAVRYNDKVTKTLLDKFRDKDAIVVFVSDHGEEVYDFNNKLIGRQHGFSDDIIRSEYEVPMWIWCSDKYMINHPEMANKIKSSTGKPFITCNISHLLLELAGIQCKYFDSTKSIISETYDTNGKRLIMVGTENEYKDYDEIIRPYRY